MLFLRSRPNRVAATTALLVAFALAVATAEAGTKRPKPSQNSGSCPPRLVFAGLTALVVGAGLAWWGFNGDAPKPLEKPAVKAVPADDEVVRAEKAHIDKFASAGPVWQMDPWPKIPEGVRVRIVAELHHTPAAIERRRELKARMAKKDIRLLIEGIENDSPMTFFEDAEVRGYSDLAILLQHGLTSPGRLSPDDHATLLRDFDRLARHRAAGQFLWPDALRDLLKDRARKNPAEQPVFEALDYFFRQVSGASDVDAAMKAFGEREFATLYAPKNRLTTFQYQRICLCAASSPMRTFVRKVAGKSVGEEDYAAIDNFADNLGPAWRNPLGPGAVEPQLLTSLVGFTSRLPRDFGMFAGILDVAKTGQDKEIEVVLGLQHAVSLYRSLLAASTQVGRAPSWVTIDLTTMEQQYREVGKLDPSMRFTAPQAREIFLHLLQRTQELEANAAKK